MAFKLFVVFAVSALLIALFCEWDTFDPVSIRGKRVLITGASSGIGEELAYQYSKLGASVVITARREQRLQKVATKCKQLGATKVEYVVADMAKPKDRQKVVSEAERHLGGLNHLILNHALTKVASPWVGSSQNLTLLNDQLQVNFVSFVDLSSKCLKMLSASNGNIGVVSSAAGKIATPYFSSYSADKFALQGFFASLRQELRVRRVNVSVTICVLGYIDTETAKENVKEVFNKLPAPAAVNVTAEDIMKGVTKRSYEIYTPKFVQFILFLHKLFPGYFEDFVTSVAIGSNDLR